MGDKPSFLRSAPRISSDERRLIHKSWRCGLASLRGVDRGVGKVYKAVKNAGDLRRTVFIFTSDNGLFHGQHRRRSGKILPYEEALRVPLVIRAPKRYRGGAARVKKVGRAVGNIDLAPTILDLAGARPCSASGDCRTMDGRSLMPILRRSGRGPRNRGFLVEYRAARRGPACDLRVRRDQDARHDLRAAFEGGRAGHQPVRIRRPAGALQPEAGSIRAPQSVLRRNQHQLSAGRQAARPRGPAEPATQLRRDRRAGRPRRRAAILRVAPAGEADPRPLLPCACRRPLPASPAQSLKQRKPT